MSALATGLAGFAVHLGKRATGPWVEITLFPALWASAWGFMSQVSPVGQLVTWSPVLGLGPYSWIRGILGQWGIDWITAAWAVVLSEVVGDWLVGSAGSDDASDSTATLIDYEHPLIPHEGGNGAVDKSSGARSRSLLSLSSILLLLMIPTYFTTHLPTAIVSDTVTPFSVACALPDPRTAKHNQLGLEDYIRATQQVQGQANIVFWPESAVRFANPDERDVAFAKIQNVTNGNKFIGVSFQEFVPALGKDRNGFVLIQRTGPPVFEYYKRNLVPSMFS